MKVKRRKGNPNVIKLVLTFLVSFQWFLDVHCEDLRVRNIELDFNKNPSTIFNSSEMADRIHVYAGYPNSQKEEEGETPIEYKVSLVLEKMNVTMTGEDKPQFNVQNSALDVTFSVYVDDTGSFNHIDHIFDGDSFVNITKIGQWTELDEARLVATIYYEADGCSDCSIGTFCCEGEREGIKSCAGEPKRFEDEEERMDIFKIFDENNNNQNNYKANTAIPSIGLKHQSRARCLNMDLRCNGHPNCAMNCNADETDDTCYNSSTECDGNTCFWNMSFVWTALLAIVFFIMAPTVVVFLICYHRQLTVVGRRRGRGSDVVTVSSPANDLPPRYDELLEETPPCFHCATSATSITETTATNPSNISGSTIITGDGNDNDQGGGGGINNLAFIPEDSMPNHKSVLCSCPSIRGGQQQQQHQQQQPGGGNRRTNNRVIGTPLPKINGDVEIASEAMEITTTNNSDNESRNSVSVNNIDSMA